MAKKRDEGHEETEERLRELERRISREYAKAEKEIADKLDDYMRRFEIKDKLKQEAVKKGLITEAEYKQWRVGQIAIGQRWEEMRDTIAQDLTNTAQIAKDLINGEMPEIYAINHNYGTYQVEQAAMVNTSYTLYDKDAVNRLWNDNNTFYKGPGKKLSKAINEGKQLAWDKKEVQSAMMQSLLQGESIGKIATRLANIVGDSDRKAMIRNARTITTGIENAGRIDSYKRAESKGIELEKQWLATLDGRTRHEHRILDGEHVPVDSKFEVDGYEIEYPGDPSAEPEMVYNCRCTMMCRLKGFEIDASNLDIRNHSKMEEETYEEWKYSHNIHSDPITKQDDIEETMKKIYGAEYRSYGLLQNDEDKGNIKQDKEHNPFGRVRFKDGGSSLFSFEEYGITKRRETVYLPSDEYARVMSEFNNNMSDSQRKDFVVTKAIGDYYYTIENYGFDNYRIIDKTPIDKEV